MSKATITKFKSGDRVVLIDYNVELPKGYIAAVDTKWIEKDEIKKGVVYTISEVSEDISNRDRVQSIRLKESANRLWLPSHCFKLLPTFKEGDKVRLVTTKSLFYDGSQEYIDKSRLKVGQTYTIDDVSNNGMDKWNNSFIYIQGHRYQHPIDCFELVTEETVPLPFLDPIPNPSVKNFKNSFGVTGSKHLIEAFKQEALAAGWFQQDKDGKCNSLVFSSTGKHSLKKNHFWYATFGTTTTTQFTLPEQWNEAIAYMSELEPVTVFRDKTWFKHSDGHVGYAFLEKGTPTISWAIKGNGCLVDKQEWYGQLNPFMTEISNKEAEKLLIEEAKKRGLVPGIYSQSVYNPIYDGILTDKYHVSSDGLWNSSRGYEVQLWEGRTSIWAEPRTKAVDITIAGYDCKVKGDRIHFGCQSYSKQDIVSYLKLFNSEVDATLTIYDVKITKQMLEQMLEQL